MSSRRIHRLIQKHEPLILPVLAILALISGMNMISNIRYQTKLKSCLTKATSLPYRTIMVNANQEEQNRFNVHLVSLGFRKEMECWKSSRSALL